MELPGGAADTGPSWREPCTTWSAHCLMPHILRLVHDQCMHMPSVHIPWCMYTHRLLQPPPHLVLAAVPVSYTVILPTVPRILYVLEHLCMYCSASGVVRAPWAGDLGSRWPAAAGARWQQLPAAASGSTASCSVMQAHTPRHQVAAHTLVTHPCPCCRAARGSINRAGAAAKWWRQAAPLPLIKAGARGSSTHQQWGRLVPRCACALSQPVTCCAGVS
jgi:hypothetical protein